MGQPVGDSPELMPLDNSLNQDVHEHESVKRHVIMPLTVTSDDVSDFDPRWFSTRTPKLGTSAYLRVFDPAIGVAPHPDRIKQDIKKVTHARKEIHKTKGAYIPGLASSNHGSKRTRLECDPTVLEDTFHVDLIAILNESRGTTSKFRLIEESHNGLDELFGE